jgi:hypothetical protein
VIIRNNNIIHFFEFILAMKIAALAFYPFIFVAESTIIDDELINHERIHLRQQLELLVIPFHIWYLIALRRKGYDNISFEKEAYANENDLSYLKKRKLFSFIKYI